MAAKMKILLAISLIYLIMVEGYKPQFSDEEKEVETRGVKVYTTGGTANGAACVFPFLYKGRIYNSCTKDSHSKYWCSTTYDYAKDYKWGNCVNVDTEPPKLLSCPSCFEISTIKSKVRGDWPIPTYSDNCGPTCLINITSNHRPSDFLQAGTSIEVRYTAEDPSGNKNVACKFTVRIKDIGSPTMLSCPDDIVASTSMRSITVDWMTPQYSDNCGPNCLLKITSNVQPQSKFYKGTTRVSYVAEDPSGNRNMDCTFSVTVKERPRTRPTPPKNGMLTEFDNIVILPSCKRGLYPTQPFPFFYKRRQGTWVAFPSHQPVTKVPDCILKTPPAGLDLGLYFFYTYDGDCNSAAAQAQAKQNMVTIGFCSGECSINKLKSFCGQTTV